ncbi:MAG TPA: helix-hairpin-helix domain-containing protein [Pyrinomonadaceae bacterium]|jgi:competence protein ComEA
MLSVRFFAFIFFSWLLVAAQLSCVRRPRSTASAVAQNAPAVASVKPRSEPLININAATRDELGRLPGIGEAMAARIIEHREKYGRFRRVEHLLMVRGISERRYQALSALLTVE